MPKHRNNGIYLSRKRQKHQKKSRSLSEILDKQGMDAVEYYDGYENMPYELRQALFGYSGGHYFSQNQFNYPRFM